MNNDLNAISVHLQGKPGNVLTCPFNLMSPFSVHEMEALK